MTTSNMVANQGYLVGLKGKELFNVSLKKDGSNLKEWNEGLHFGFSLLGTSWLWDYDYSIVVPKDQRDSCRKEREMSKKIRKNKKEFLTLKKEAIGRIKTEKPQEGATGSRSPSRSPTSRASPPPEESKSEAQQVYETLRCC